MCSNKILLVEDHPDNSQLFMQFLEWKGYETRLAQSCEEVLQALEIFRPDLILLDILMAGKSGLELIQDIHKDRAHSSVSIVAFSALDARETIEKARAAGCSGYIQKPIRLDDLAARVKYYLTRCKEI